METNILKQRLAKSQRLLHLVLSKRYNTNAPYPGEAEQFSSQSGGVYAENKYAKTMTCSKSAANTLTCATKVMPMPKVLVQLNKSVFSKQKEYTEKK